MSETIKHPCYLVKKATNNEWYWTYYARNGRAISRASETYVRKADCLRSIEIMKESPSSGVYEV